MASEMTTCEFHGLTVPAGYSCPACQRTDSNIMAIWREVRAVAKRMKAIEEKLDALAAPDPKGE